MEAFLAPTATESSLIVEALKKSPVKKKPNTVSGKGNFSSINFEKQQGIDQNICLTLSDVFLYKAGIYEPLQGTVL